MEAENEDPRNQRPASKRELDKIGIMKRNDIESLDSDHFSSSPTWRGSYDSFRGRPDPHWLPDTFEYLSNRFPASCEARVEYELTATLKRPTRGILFPAKDLETSLDVVVRSRNHLGTTLGQRITSPDGTKIVKIKNDFAAARLASVSGTKTSSLNRKIVKVFKSSDLQEFNMNISVLFDRYLRPGGSYPLLLQISQEDPADSTLLPITLRSYILRLIARTSLRGKQEAVMVQDVNHHALESRVLFAGKGLDLEVPYGDGSEGAETLKRSLREDSTSSLLDSWLNLSARLPTFESDRQFMTPTFKTYNMNREYELGIEMKLECAGVKYDIKCENIAVTVLAEEDHPATVRKNNVGVAAPQDETRDIKGIRERPEDPPTINEKRGPVPPPPRDEQPEPPPKYEPGDVPDYHDQLNQPGE